MIWANLLHLSTNIWFDAPQQGYPYNDMHRHAALRLEHGMWRDLLRRTTDAGLNMVVLDLADGVLYDSHPEIAVENAWTREQLRAELEFMRGLGLEPIPKLNFSAAHDIWLGEYHRMVSTRKYYEVCADLINEVIELFDRPRFFHIGMDEEDAAHQEKYEYAVVRQHDLWWHDLLFYVEQVERAGVRAWMWSDCVWNHTDEFFRRMPKSVLQSNWYYGEEFEEAALEDWNRPYLRAYRQLEEHGYDQVPTGGNWTFPVDFRATRNFERTVEYCSRQIAPERLRGFMQSCWRPAIEKYRAEHEAAIAQAARGIAIRKNNVTAA
jgi:hypothetical protein